MFITGAIILFLMLAWYGKGGWATLLFRAPFFALIIFWLIFGCEAT